MAYAPHELVAKWRRQAMESPGTSVAEAYAECADELEQALAAPAKRTLPDVCMVPACGCTGLAHP